MNTLMLIFGVVVVLLLLGGWRLRLSRLIWALFGVVAGIVIAGAAVLVCARAFLVSGVARTRAALAFQSTGGVEHAPSAWDVIGPLVYSLFATAILAGDLVLAGLRFGALLGIPVGDLPINDQILDLFAGVLFVAVVGTFGLLLLDVLHVTPTARPFGVAGKRAHRLLQGIAIGGTACAVLAGSLFLIWGQGAIAGSPNGDLATLFIASFGALLVVASIIAIAGALALPLVVWLGVQAVLLAAVVATGWLLRLTGAMVRGLHELVQAALLAAAWPGEALWNWLAGRTGARIGIVPVATPAPLPPLGRPWPAEPGQLMHPAIALPSAPADELTSRPAV
ncbi:hypothetical protein [Pseudonocardia sp. 73-21]|uniref:hypothetical protein n=1 Tax=Pseudonocardia sp. 73-21 TaxID=1895809 RepID=UPI0026118C96|nr:hypothetical protein [Pseudonocardia sp. 73-21]